MKLQKKLLDTPFQKKIKICTQKKCKDIMATMDTGATRSIIGLKTLEEIDAKPGLEYDIYLPDGRKVPSRFYDVSVEVDNTVSDIYVLGADLFMGNVLGEDFFIKNKSCLCYDEDGVIVK